MPQFSERLLAWFDQHGRRDLPWQHPRTPYRVWVSEIMLQQTQVATVIPYFERFIARFPSIAALAESPLDEVLHHWSGLGYYARARNLHRAATTVLRDHRGELPRVLEAVLALPGIGRSTGAAILALSHDQRHAILDGNVKRVLARQHALAGWPAASAVQKTLWAIADALTPDRRVADYTQAIMDLGATVCTRRRPRCDVCPVQGSCVAYRNGTVARYPSARVRRALPTRAANFLVLETRNGELLLERRPPQGIWGGLWSFPELDDADDYRAWCVTRGLDVRGTPTRLPPIHHTFTHFRLVITPLVCPVVTRGVPSMDSDRWLWYNSAAPAQVGLAKPVSAIIFALRDNRNGA